MLWFDEKSISNTHTCFIASRASSKAWATFVAMEASKASSKILLWTTSTSIYSMYLLDAEQTTLYFHIDRENELYCIILYFIAYTSFGNVNWYKKNKPAKCPFTYEANHLVLFDVNDSFLFDIMHKFRLVGPFSKILLSNYLDLCITVYWVQNLFCSSLFPPSITRSYLFCSIKNPSLSSFSII